MKIIKPATLGLLQRTYTLARAHRFVVTVLGFFTPGEPVPARLLPEAAQWPLVSGALPPMQPLDEAMPKSCAEALVLGAVLPRPEGEARFRLGRIDKRLALGGLAQLGPLPMQAPERQRHAGTYDGKWLKEDWPGLARDLDWRLYNQAREDQQVDGWFAGGERYCLEGMSTTQPRIAGRLPTQRVRAFALRDALHEVPLVFDTVWFFPATGVAACAWRGQLAVDDSDALDVRTLLLAYEDGAAAALPVAHYAEALRLRSDPATAPLHAFHESQLAPAQAGAQVVLPPANVPAQLASPPQPSGLTLPALQPPSAAAVAAGDMDLTAFMKQVDALPVAAQLAAARQLAQDGLARQAAQAPLPAPRIEEVMARAEAMPPPLARLRQASPGPVAPAQVLPPEVAAQLGRQVQAWHAQGKPLAGHDLAGADLRGARLAGADLSGSLLECADLRGADLRGAKLRGAALTQADLSGADLTGADLTEANLCGSQGENACFEQASLNHARATKACWRGARGAQADLTAALLEQTDLSLACFDGARLDCTLLSETVLAGGSWREAQFQRCVGWKVQALGADFSGSRWMRSALTGCDLEASRWQDARLEQTSGAGSRWLAADLRGLRAQRCTWSGAVLQRADFRDAFLGNCDLSRADLQEATLAEGCFAHSVLMQANCRGARAGGADFFQALLRKSDFEQADLRDASLYRADLTGMHLEHARLEGVALHERGRLP